MSDIEIEYVEDDSDDVTASKRVVLSIIRKHRRMRPKDLCKRVPLHPATTRRYTRKLADEGLIEKVDGYWVLPEDCHRSAEKTSQLSRLSYLMQEIRRLKREAQRILETLAKEIV